MAIGGTVTSGTTGSCLYIGAGPVLAQDNANCFWDATNHRLGIGTTSPAEAETIFKASDNQLGLDASGQYTYMYLKHGGSQRSQFGWDDTAKILSIGTIVSGTAEDIALSASNTVASPTLVYLKGSTGRVGIGSGFTAPLARLDVGADNNVNAFKITNTSVTDGWVFYSATNGAHTDLRLQDSVGVDRVNFQYLGNVGIGTTTNPAAKLEVNGTLLVDNTIQSTATLQNGIYTVAGLPTCNGAAEGKRAGASDLLAPTFLTIATGGGAVHGSVYCNGTNWVTD